jgi:hypothetical protein
MRNKVLASRFIDWRLGTSDDIEEIGMKVMMALTNHGAFFITAELLFMECGYIPQHICVDDKGDSEYTTDEVEFIDDLIN